MARKFFTTALVRVIELEEDDVVMHEGHAFYVLDVDRYDPQGESVTTGGTHHAVYLQRPRWDNSRRVPANATPALWETVVLLCGESDLLTVQVAQD